MRFLYGIVNLFDLVVLVLSSTYGVYILLTYLKLLATGSSVNISTPYFFCFFSLMFLAVIYTFLMHNRAMKMKSFKLYKK